MTVPPGLGGQEQGQRVAATRESHRDWRGVTSDEPRAQDGLDPYRAVGVREAACRRYSPRPHLACARAPAAPFMSEGGALG